MDTAYIALSIAGVEAYKVAAEYPDKVAVPLGMIGRTVTSELVRAAVK
jgi:hypothetical protein